MTFKPVESIGRIKEYSRMCGRK